MTKKGMSTKTLAALILVIVSAGILLTWITTVSNEAERSGVVDQCRNTVLLKGIDLDWNADELIDTPLACTSFDEGVLEGNREEVKKQVADLMAECWYMYAEGSVDNVFEKASDVDSCAICSTFRVPDDLGEGGTPENQQILSEPESLDDISLEDITVEGENEQTYRLEQTNDGIVLKDEEGTVIDRLDNVSDMITAPEMYNYLFNTPYNPSVVRGGGTGNYYGDGVDMSNLDLEYDQRAADIDLTDLESQTGYIRDEANILNQQTKDAIVNLGGRLDDEEIGNLAVITGKTVNPLTEDGVKNMIDITGLNSNNSLDALVILIDAENAKMRVTIGEELERFITEQELKQVLKPFETEVTTQSQFNAEIRNMISVFDRNIKIEETGFEDIYGTDSYMAYVSNRGSQTPLIENIRESERYAVAYLGEGNDWEIAKIVAPAGATATLAVIGTVATGGTAMLGWGGIAAAGGLAGGGAGTAWEWFWQEDNPKKKLIVGPTDKLGQECDILAQ